MQNNRFKRKFLANIWLARSVLMVAVISGVIIAGFLGYKVFKPVSPYLFGQTLAADSGRTNILLLGIRGIGEEGPDITDTIILASLRHSDGQVSLISTPRDLWSGTIKAKINSAYHLGFVKEGTTGGLLLSRSIVSELTGIPIHYAAVIDFSLFTRFIDALGGVEIDVTKTFDDFKYPVTGKENDLCNGDPLTLCRYEHLHFDKGVIQMNGEMTLKYVRSRQSTDLSEGTDFARSIRQEQVITAVKAKLLKQNPKKYLELYRLVKASIITDLKPQNYIPLGKILLKSRKLPLESFSISEDNVLENPPGGLQYNNQWVLIPKGGDPNLISKYVHDNLRD